MESVQLGYYDFYPNVGEVLPYRLLALQGAIPAGSTLIDLGCNDGRISLVLLKHGHAASSLGIDFADIRLEAPPEFRFVQGDLRKLDLTALPHVDVILCLNVLQHMCEVSPEFARQFISELALHAGTVICEMGSQTEDLNVPWRDIMRARWKNDNECWAYMFQQFRWRKPLLTYSVRNGHRVMWKLVTDREPAYQFDLVEETAAAETSTRRLRRAGTDDLYWAKSYRGTRSSAAHVRARALIHEALRGVPYECFLPLTSGSEHGDVYAYDSEVARAVPLTVIDVLRQSPQAQQQEYAAFSSIAIPGLDGFPIDLLCDFHAASVQRGVVFFHFEPTELAIRTASQAT